MHEYVTRVIDLPGSWNVFQGSITLRTFHELESVGLGV